MEVRSDCESDRSIASLAANSDVIDLDQDEEDFDTPPRLRPEQIRILKSKFQTNQSPDWEQVISAPLPLANDISHKKIMFSGRVHGRRVWSGRE